jgi:hypothetical protein
MSSRLPLVAAVSSVLAVLPAVALAAPGADVVAAAQPGPASVQLLECVNGKKAPQRSALFRAEMTQIAVAQRMRLHFTLYEKVGSSTSWRRVLESPWHHSNPGVKRFAYQQRVAGLRSATKYRMKVSFHWLDADGNVVAESSANSKSCRQRGKLPNLGIRGAIKMREAATRGTYRYVVRIHNNGAAASPRSALRLVVDGAEVDVRPIGRLRKGERRTVRFVGPPCAGEVSAQLDPTDAVREVTEKDNTRVAACSPAP